MDDLLTQRKVMQMQRLRHGATDCVVVGASSGYFGINPVQIASLLGWTGHVYNACINRGTPPLTEAFLDEVVLRVLKPKRVIIALSVVPTTTMPMALPDWRIIEGRSHGTDASRSGRLGSPQTARFYAYAPLLVRMPNQLLSQLRRVAKPLLSASTASAFDGLVDEFGCGVECDERSYWNGPKLAEVLRERMTANFSVGGAQLDRVLRMQERVEATGGQFIVVVMPTVRSAIIEELGVPSSSLDDAFAVLSSRVHHLIDIRDSVSDTRFFADFVHLNAAGRRLASEALATRLSSGASRPDHVRL